MTLNEWILALANFRDHLKDSYPGIENLPLVLATDDLPGSEPVCDVYMLELVLPGTARALELKEISEDCDSNCVIEQEPPFILGFVG